MKVPFLDLRRGGPDLDEALHAIAVHYGEPTANVVAMQLEYPR